MAEIEELHLSASGYARLVKCETRWLRQHREEDVSPRASEGPMFLGTLTHLLVQAFWEGKAWSDVLAAELSNVVGWEPGYQEPEAFTRAAWIMSRYAEHYGPMLPEWEHVATEVPFDLPFNAVKGASVKGFIDLILRNRKTGALWVREIKTMGKWDRCNLVPFDPQLWLYLHGARKTGYPVIGAQFDAIYTYQYRGKVARPASDSFRQIDIADDGPQLRRILAEYEVAASRARLLVDGVLRPTKALSDACTYCQFYEGCATPPAVSVVAAHGDA